MTKHTDCDDTALLELVGSLLDCANAVHRASDHIQALATSACSDPDAVPSQLSLVGLMTAAAQPLAHRRPVAELELVNAVVEGITEALRNDIPSASADRPVG